MKSIDHFAAGRDNNFNLIRFVAAVLVIYAHSYVLSWGIHQDPLKRLINHSFGEIAVNIFFITSGFLVTKSLLARAGLFSFFWARIVRIYPALIVALVGSVVVVGCVFSRLPAREFFSSNASYSYIIRTLVLINNDIQFFLPGVFENLPFPKAVNGSLWTLPWEFWMYISLGIVGMFSFLRKPIIFALAIVVAASLYFANTIFNFAPGTFAQLCLRFTAYFYLGALCFLLRRHIPLGYFPLLGLAVAVVILYKTPLFMMLFTFALVYAVFCIAYLPAGKIRNFNRIGDYSYGLYIYAFPVQQSISALLPGIGPWRMFFVATATTLFFAVLSWHFIEKPALQYKHLAEPLDRKWQGRQSQMVNWLRNLRQLLPIKPDEQSEGA